MKTRTEEIIKANDNFFSIAEKTNAQIYKDVKEYLLQLIKDGKLSLDNKELTQLTLNIQAEILKSIDKTGYYEGIKQYKSTLTTVERIIVEQYAEITGVAVGEVVFNNKFRNNVLKSLDNHLLGRAFLADIVQPMRDVIVQQALLGLDYEQATKIISDYIDKNGLQKKLKRVQAGQVGRDILNQYDGAIQNEIRKKYDFDGFRYIGGLVEDSRPVCTKLSEKLIWSLDELQVVLGEYCPNGIPSKVPITYRTIPLPPEEGGGFKIKKGKKGGGMIEGTSVDNFGIVRGGYNCLHEVIFTYI